METLDLSVGLKRPQHDTDHTPPSSAEFMNARYVPPLHSAPCRGSHILVTIESLLAVRLSALPAVCPVPQEDPGIHSC
jgi:hypothetical protein